MKNSATKLGYVWQSTGCDSFHWQRVGRKFQKGNSTKYSAGAARAPGSRRAHRVALVP